MKILLLVYGEYRRAETATKSWNVLNNNSVDVVVHTQNTSIDYVKSDNLVYEQTVTEDMINTLFPNSTIFLEDRDGYESDNEFNDANMNIRSFRFLYNQVRDNIDDYDLVMISRIDSTFYIHDIEEFYKSHDMESIYVEQLPKVNEDGLWMQDHVFYGSTEVMKQFLHNLPKHINSSHQEVPIYLKESGIECKTWDGSSSFHLRPNMEKYYKEHFKEHGRCANKDDEYLRFHSHFFYSGIHVNLEQKIKV